MFENPARPRGARTKTVTIDWKRLKWRKINRSNAVFPSCGSKLALSSIIYLFLLSRSFHQWNQPVIQVCNLTCISFYLLSKHSILPSEISLKKNLRLYTCTNTFSLPCSTRGFQFPFPWVYFASTTMTGCFFFHPHTLLALFFFCLKLCGTHFSSHHCTHVDRYSALNINFSRSHDKSSLA